ncbi:hypothetical protein FACS1894130_11480 [Spirochaetia bacterium]|nr:hypothetical protein FACS1894130_11480 [Spirochaetia bacterium]
MASIYGIRGRFIQSYKETTRDGVGRTIVRGALVRVDGKLPDFSPNGSVSVHKGRKFPYESKPKGLTYRKQVE